MKSHYTAVLKGGPDDDDDMPSSQHTEPTAATTYSMGVLNDESNNGSNPAPAPKKSAMKIKRVKSSDMLRMQIDEMMFESEEKERKAEADLAEQKAKYDANRAEDKARADREKEYLRSRINELMGEVQAAEHAKAESDAKLHSVSSNDLSIATSSTHSDQERLKKQVDDGVEERKVLEERIANMEAEIEESTRRKEAAKARAKKDKDVANEAKLALEKQVDELRREVEEAAFSKYLMGQELEEAKRMSSDSNSSNDAAQDEKVAELERQLEHMIASKKAGDDAGAAREAKLEADVAAQKEAGDAREKELRSRLAVLLEQVDDAAFKKLEDDEIGRAVKEGLQQQILELQQEVASAVSAKKKSDDEKEAAVSAKIKSDSDKNAAISELDKIKENNSSEDSSAELSELRKQLFKMKAKNNDLRTERALIESFAIAREEEDQEEMDRALEEKTQEVEALRSEMEDVMTAKLEAERERDMAMSETMSSVTGFTDERALALQIELEELLAAKEAAEEDAAERERELEAAVEDMKVKQKEDQDTGAAREKELKDKVESLLESANEAKSRKLISDGEHKAAIDDANAKEDQLMKRLKFLQEEVETAVFQKHLADEELGKIKSSSASQSDTCSSDSSALASRLKASEDEILALKGAASKNETAKDAALKASQDEVQALKEAVAKSKTDRDDELKTSQDEVEALKNAAIKEKIDRDKERAENDAELKALQDESLAKKDELERMIKTLQGETQAKLKAESELHRALSSDSESSGTGSSDAQVAALLKELDDLKKLKSASDRAGAARESKLAAQVSKLQGDFAVAAEKASFDMENAKVALKDAAAKANVASKKEHRAEIDALQEKLRAMQAEVESAVFAKVLAESEMDKAVSSDASVSTSSSSDAEKIAMLRKELYDSKVESRAKEDASAARERKLVGDLQTIKEEADTAALANKEELDRTVKALENETQARVDAEKGLQRAISDSASSGVSSSGDPHLSTVQKELDELKVSKSVSDRAGTARERKLEADVAEEAFLKQKLEDEKIALLAQLEKMQEDVDKAVFDKKMSLDEAAAADEKMQQRVKFLQEEMDAVMYQKHISDMEVDRLKNSSGSQAGSSDDDVMAAELRAENDELKLQKKLDQDKAAQDKTMADDTILQLKEELSLLQEQATVLSRGKDLAEDEVRALKHSSNGGANANNDEAADVILLQKIEQLRSEKELSYSIASTMKKQLEAGKKVLEDRLDEMESAKKEADDKLDASNMLSDRLHKEISNLKSQKKADGLELQNKIDSLEEDLRKARAPSPGSSDGSENHEVNKLVQDLAEMKSEKDATEKRLAWEKSTKRDLRQQIMALQERARAADRAKQISENELKELQEQSETQTSESMEEVAEKLRQQVQSLQQEKGVTLHKLAELEEAVATGELDFGEGGRVREAYVDKLKNDIEKLETSVDNLSNENKLLLDSKMRLEGEMGKDDKSKFSCLDDEISNLSRQTRDLTRTLDLTRKEADDAKVAQKEEKDQVLDLQARMDKTILQLATLKSSNRVNMERLKGEHAEELKAAKDSSASLMHTELIEIRNERDELKRALGRKKGKEEYSTVESITDAALADLRNMLGNAREENDVLKTKLREKDKETAALKDKEKEYEEEMLRLKHSLNEANAKNHDLEHSIKTIKSEDQLNLSRVQREAGAEKASLTERIEVSEKAHAERITDYEKEIATLKKELENERAQKQSNGDSITGTDSNAEATDMVDLLRKALEEEKTQRRAAKLEAVNLKASMEQYDITMTHMRREMTDLRSTKDEAVARLKAENQKLQKENQIMNQPGGQLPPILSSRNGVETNDFVSTATGHDLDSLILELQGTAPTQAMDEINMVAHFAPISQSSQPTGAIRTRGCDVTASTVRNNHFVSSASAVDGPSTSHISSTSVSVQARNDAAEELDRINAISNHFKLLYESKSIALKETQMERDALRFELQKYYTTQ